MAAYVLVEMSSPRERARTVAALWRRTKQVLVLVEPGTPAGSATVRAARTQVSSRTHQQLRACTAWPGSIPAAAQQLTRHRLQVIMLQRSTHCLQAMALCDSHAMLKGVFLDAAWSCRCWSRPRANVMWSHPAHMTVSAPWTARNPGATSRSASSAAYCNGQPRSVKGAELCECQHICTFRLCQ